MEVTMSQTKLFNRNFSILVTGQIVTLFGAALLRFALSLYALDLTGRSDVFALMLVLAYLPLLLAPVAGAIADRVRRRELIVAIDVLNGLIMLGFIALSQVQENPSLIVIGAVMMLLGLTSAFDTPAVQASVPLLVPEERLEQAIGITQSVNSLSGTIAPIIGGLLYEFFGVSVLMVASCIAFFVAAAIEACVNIPHTKRARRASLLRSIGRETMEGLRFLKHTKIIQSMAIITVLINLFLSAYFLVMVPLILKQTLHAGGLLYGIGLGIMELGVIAGSLSIGLFMKRLHVNTLYRWFVLMGVIMVPMSLMVLPRIAQFQYVSFILYFALLFLVLVICGFTNIFFLSYIQRITPDAMMGKVMATVSALVTLSIVIGQTLYGYLFQSFDPAYAFVPSLIAAVIMIAVGLIAKPLLASDDAKSKSVTTVDHHS
jgi:MFS family permease